MYKPKEIANYKEIILERLSEGESLNVICQDKGMLSSREVYRLLNKDTDFRHNYTRARHDQALFYVEKNQEVIDAIPKKPTREQLDKARLILENNRWNASRLLPKVFGNAINQTNIQINTEQITGMKIIDSDEKEQ